MIESLEVFHFEENKNSFEDFGFTNGGRLWYARDLMNFLGYSDFNTFRNVINRATHACMVLKININDNFIETERVIEGKKYKDYKLSRFACYLVAMNGDPKKPQVAKAQIYFVSIAETFRHYLEEAVNVERVLIRDDISEREKSLSGVAKMHNVENYAFFQNAGYLGMYNCNLSDLKIKKGLIYHQSGRSLLDFMGKQELAANLFRITQTEAKIQNENLKGQEKLEYAARSVGKKVRDIMIETSGTKPEELPLNGDINDVRKALKSTYKKLKQLDK
jgi:DNA-damage-inducible protein D